MLTKAMIGWAVSSIVGGFYFGRVFSLNSRKPEKPCSPQNSCVEQPIPTSGYLHDIVRL